MMVDRYLGRIDVAADNDAIRKSIEDAGITLLKLSNNKRNHERFKLFKLTVKRSELHKIEDPNFWLVGVVLRNFFRLREARDSRVVPPNEDGCAHSTNAALS
jgi:hypothetical protein